MTNSQRGGKPRVLVAASGTGGHLFPALYIIQVLLRRGAEVEFVGSGRPLEEEILARTGIKRHVLKTVGIKNRGIKGFIEFVRTLPNAYAQCLNIFKRFEPEAVLGVGGYVTFLPVMIAWSKRMPSWIHEGELRAGLANAVLCKFASRVSTAFSATKVPKGPKRVFTGQPLREEMDVVAKERHPVIDPRRVLIVGGSQGANSLDQAMLALEGFIRTHNISIWHQCRQENQSKLEEFYTRVKVEHTVVTFIRELADAYRWCDIVVSRSGAGAVMELGVLNRPCVLVPYPHAQGNHQLHNSKVLVDQGKAILVEEGERFSERLRDAIHHLLNREHYMEMVNRAIEKRPKNAAEQIADGCLALAAEWREKSEQKSA